IYAASTIVSLAQALKPAAPNGVAAALPQGAPPHGSSLTGRPDRPGGSEEDLSAGTAPDSAEVTSAQVSRPGRWAPLACGTAQAGWLVVYPALTLILMFWGYQWIALGTGLADIYLRSLMVGAGIFAFQAILPIVLKWALVGRWSPGEFPIWSLRYLRFWIVKTTIRTSPLVLFFAGSPMYVLYLRALGAKVGAGAVILTRHLPVCTDLLTVGAGAVVRKDTYLSCYRARGRVIETGRVTLGAEAFVGEFAVLDIATSMGEGAQLGHSSSLHAGQSIPAGQSWHGTPAQPSSAIYRLEARTAHGARRRVTYSAAQLLFYMVLVLPFLTGFLETLVSASPWAPNLNPGATLVSSLGFYAEAALAAGVLVLGGLGAGLVLVTTLPRLLNQFLIPGRSYPLYGRHYSIHRGVGLLTNIPPLSDLFGDSSPITTYLQAVGYRMRPVQQTGSNFGQMVKHENPYLTTVGSGTMAADGLSVLNADYSATAFRLAPTRIGAHSFLGNFVVYPSGARVGDNVLLGTKVAVPLDGPVRQDVGLLGSPAFEIPRTVQRDTALGLTTRAELRRRLRAKLRHNRVTMVWHLLSRWFQVYVVFILMGTVLDLLPTYGPLVAVLADTVLLAFIVGYSVLVERVLSRAQLLAPQGCSIYEPDFWRHERYWKVPAIKFLAMFDGTPMKSHIWRLMGVRVGRGLFDDGCFIPERGFVSIGDDCTFNVGTSLQSHSQEDGAFKSDHVTIGSRCTIGTGSLVHYGVSVGDDVELGPDSFVMKGEEVPDGAHWAGNPANAISKDHPRSAPATATATATALTTVRTLAAAGTGKL
ncbi:MAG: Pls/PosA family non-ribosomal peptide synthetase, partial [Dermatophilaceae bacterium]